MTKILKLKEIEEKMDIVNGDYGTRGELCIYCKSQEWNAQVGIIHTKTCAIQRIRDIIKEEQEYY